MKKITYVQTISRKVALEIEDFTYEKIMDPLIDSSEEHEDIFNLALKMLSDATIEQEEFQNGICEDEEGNVLFKI